jgi:C4-dicarboxylate-specific signal transduction histidine kinase
MEREKLQEYTAKAKKTASLSAMSAGVVHEIAQPLNAIKVLADGILYWYEKEQVLNLDEAVETFRRISSQANRIDDIIKYMRSFASVGGQTLMEPCNWNRVVNGALSMVGRQFSAHGIEIKIELAEQLPDIWGNVNRLEEAVINLLINAMQSLDARNQLDKEVACITYIVKDIAVLEIRDNAGGIEEGILEKIFEPFFSTKNQGEGMGLGLSIVQSIMSSYKGQIKAFNNEQGGATFILEMPIIKD